MVVDNINNPMAVDVYDIGDKLLKHIDMPMQISGYEYQFKECMEQIDQGMIESVSMPLDESIFIMELADSIRRQWGLVYPQEK